MLYCTVLTRCCWILCITLPRTLEYVFGISVMVLTLLWQGLIIRTQIVPWRINKLRKIGYSLPKASKIEAITFVADDGPYFKKKSIKECLAPFTVIVITCIVKKQRIEKCDHCYAAWASGWMHRIWIHTNIDLTTGTIIFSTILRSVVSIYFHDKYIKSHWLCLFDHYNGLYCS